MHTVTIGDYRCFQLSDGYFRLDGGAMFGVTPRTLWGKYYEYDDNNRIRLGLTSLIIAGRGMVLLVEGGAGQVFDGNEKLAAIYHMESVNLLEAEMEAAGFTAADVNTVVYTHLHWDHAGAACSKHEGVYRPRFPGAGYIVQKHEWEEAVSGSAESRGSYIPESLLPLETAGQLRIIDGDYSINEDIRLMVTGGHTRGHQVLILESGGKSLIYWGDLIPTPQHVHLPNIMAYDRYPVDTYRMKERLLKKAVAGNSIAVFPHSLSTGFGIIRHDGRRYGFHAVEPSAV